LKETDKFLSGAGRFVEDLRLEGMLHLKMVRSPYARARILKVKGGITGSEFRANLVSVGEGAWGGPVSVSYPALPTEYVSYSGQSVAGVLGKDPYEAEDLLEQVEVDYEPLKPLINPEEAKTFEPIHPNVKSNIVNETQLGKDFIDDSPIVLEDVLANARLSPNPMEPRAMVARYDGSRLTVWASTQSVHTWKEAIGDIMKLPPEAVRVIQMDTGGAFGAKSSLYPEYAVACYAAIKTRKPVKWVETRSEHLLATSQGRGARARMRIFADREGRVSGLKADLLVDNGAFAVGIGASAPRFIGYLLTGPYAIKKAYITAASVYTNKVPLGPYRGAGRPESAFFIERMMDLLADELKQDPVEIRLRNASSKQFVSPLGLKVDPLEPFLTKAAEQLGYWGRAKEKGIGFSCFILPSAVQPGESARIAIKGGSVRVWIGGGQSGQRHEVIARSVLKEELGIPESAVKLEMGDTDELDEGVGTWGSRTAIVAGAALVDAAGKIRKQAKKLGASSPDELLQHDFDVKVFHYMRESTSSLGANLVGVSLSESGEAKVEECLAFYDIGKVLDKENVEAQVVGGSAQGIGQALSEESWYNEEGQLITGTLADTGLPLASSIPRVVVRLAEHPPSEGLRVKGVGEAATTGLPPAVIRALERVLGRRLQKTPVHQDELLPRK
jgi:carbon-monoxide dehydrogenase large subunit